MGGLRARAVGVVIAMLATAPILTACGDQRSTPRAATGATPALQIPVGPPPGPKVQRSAAKNPYASDAVMLTEGRQLFMRMNCGGCHGEHGGGGMGPSLRDTDWIYGSSDAEVFDSIAEGRAHGMPAWGTKLPEREIWKITAYVKSLRTPLEPQAPK